MPTNPSKTNQALHIMKHCTTPQIVTPVILKTAHDYFHNEPSKFSEWYHEITKDHRLMTVKDAIAFNQTTLDEGKAVVNDASPYRLYCLKEMAVNLPILMPRYRRMIKHLKELKIVLPKERNVIRRLKRLDARPNDWIVQVVFNFKKITWADAVTLRRAIDVMTLNPTRKAELLKAYAEKHADEIIKKYRKFNK